MQERQNFFRLKVNGIMGLISVILFFVVLFFLARGIFTILAWAAPVLIIAALVINYRTVVGYLKFLWDLLRRRPLMGIVGIILSVIGFPIVSGFLLGKAILDKRIHSYKQEIQQQRDGVLVEYEDVTESEPTRKALDLEVLPPEADTKNTYDDFFEDSPDRK
jgi:hypothetical protein